MEPFPKPIIVVSKCIEFSACRYNGDKLTDTTVANLKPYVTFIPVCPEVEIGLGTPREVIRLVADGDTERLIQPKTLADFTEPMAEFADEFIGSLKEVDGFILKSRSPSCGITDAKVYAAVEKSPTIRTGKGAFTSKIEMYFPNAVLEDEGRLKNFVIREHFFTKLFTKTQFRHLKVDLKINELHDFHKKNKYLFMAYNQQQLKKLGRIISNSKGISLEHIFAEYEMELTKLFKRAPRYTSNINVCERIFGYFSSHLTSKEKQYFLSTLEKYRARKLPISSVVTILKAWAYRFNSDYLLEQTYFQPYPEGLLEITDSGKGRDYR